VQGYTHDGEFILVAEDGANDVKNYPVQYVIGKVWVNNHAHVLQAKEGLAATRFLQYAFSQINVEIFLVGGGRSKLNAETMMQIQLCAPRDIEEQQQIGTYFCMLDKLISKHAIQLQKLKQIKSACLEKMFV
jgi:type I restriction enzyme S subunit